jgi:hypothetical protein
VRDEIAVVVLASCLGGCVFPADEPTGAELSWRFYELNIVDGEDAARVRTCAGALADRVEIAIVDRDDARRRGTFDYECGMGFQTVDQFQTEASDAFIELQPGTYDVQVEIVDTLGFREVTANRELDVLSRTLTVEALELARATAPWPLRLSGTDTCTELGVRLLYADPENHLSDPPLDEDGNVQPTVYRENLFSDRGLHAGGAANPCAGMAGLHVFPEVDVGGYRLELTVDGAPCVIPVSVDPTVPEATLDLANLACDG